MSHYRLSGIRQQDIELKEDAEGYELEPASALGTAKVKDKKEEFIDRLPP